MARLVSDRPFSALTDAAKTGAETDRPMAVLVERAGPVTETVLVAPSSPLVLEPRTSLAKDVSDLTVAG